MESIFIKEEVYLAQMSSVRETVLGFGEAHGWQPLRRGRHAHASIFGPVHGFGGVINIEMTHVTWEEMPDSLTPDWRFTLWASASDERQGVRWFATKELYWEACFAEVPLYVDRFLETAWQMLIEFRADDFVEQWPGPAIDPDLRPNFGPPRLRATSPAPRHPRHGV